ncbi:hypothetical protein [Actinoplanes siamensis]|uniref:Uncharacterized protein n=1 Tax=Actinoplanes siamensis TaxID=1223317 RepID=A0A919TMT8_9ACTN|nr:hypothetical protein [Actinoplanes siamensis]GIF08706.1 hypothetical protein Asi03nite_62440 [Actinoplanes siamensis]
MTAYALLWELLKHALCGRGGDQVYLLAGGDPAVDYPADDFSWADDQDRFCVIQAVQP